MAAEGCWTSFGPCITDFIPPQDAGFDPAWSSSKNEV